jgi:hypothetical protein
MCAPTPLVAAPKRETVVWETLAHQQTAYSMWITVCTSRDLADEFSHGAMERSISHSTIARVWMTMGTPT